MRILMAVMVCVSGVMLVQPSSLWSQESVRCPFLDVRADPVYTLGVGAVLPAEVDGGRDFSLMEMDMQSEFLYFQDVLLGDLDLRLDFHSDVPLNSGGLKLPDTLMVVSMDGRWTWRYVNDTAFQLRFQPGFYSPIETIDTDSMAMPLTFTGVKTVDETLSAVVGFSLRLRFEREFLPLAGIVWQPTDEFRMEAMVPASRVIYYLAPELSIYAGWTWESMTYQIPDDDYDRERVTLEAMRLSAGVTREMTKEFRISAELGLLTGRSVAFEHGDVDVDKAPYARVSVGGAF